MDRLYMILLGIVQSEPNSSIDCQIANYLLEHILDLNDITANELAEICQVSKSSISRFCRRVGLSSFHELKHMLHHYLPDTSKFFFTPVHTKDNILFQYIDTISHHINQLKTMIDFDIIDTITEDIHRYQHVIMAGSLQANTICLNLQLNLFSCGKICQAKVKFSELRELILNSDENTLIIVFSSRGAFFNRHFVHEDRMTALSKPKIYMITASARMTAHPYVNETLHFHAPSDFASGTFQMEIIANLIAISYHEKTKHHAFKS